MPKLSFCKILKINKKGGIDFEYNRWKGETKNVKAVHHSFIFITDVIYVVGVLKSQHSDKIRK